MEVDSIAKPLSVAKAARAFLDPLDAAVHALGMAIVSTKHDRVQDAPQSALDGLPDLLHGFEAAALCPAEPALPALLRPGARLVMPQAHRFLLEGPSSRRLQGAQPERGEVLPLSPRHILRIHQPAILAAFERVVTRLQQATMFLPAHPVDAV